MVHIFRLLVNPFWNVWTLGRIIMLKYVTVTIQVLSLYILVLVRELKSMINRFEIPVFSIVQIKLSFIKTKHNNDERKTALYFKCYSTFLCVLYKSVYPTIVKLLWSYCIFVTYDSCLISLACFTQTSQAIIIIQPLYKLLCCTSLLSKNLSLLFLL